MTVEAGGGPPGAGADGGWEEPGSWLWLEGCPGPLCADAGLLHVWLLKEPVLF